jgi:hypothetical protein
MADTASDRGSPDAHGEPADHEEGIPAPAAGSLLEQPEADDGEQGRGKLGEAEPAAATPAGTGGPERHTDRPARRRFSWRTPAAVVLIVFGCVFAPLSVVAVWTANQVSNTDRFVANMAPLIHEPAIQRALTDKITTEITTRLKVEGLAEQVSSALTQAGLPRVGTLLHSAAGPLASGVDGFIHTEVAKVVASPRVARLWPQLLRTIHAELVKALSGRGSGTVSVRNGQVVVGLGPLINEVKSQLAARGFTLVSKIPEINPTVALFSAKYLVKAQNAYRLLNDLKIALPILTVVLLGLGVWVARNHVRALIGAGLGLAASMLVLGAGLTVFRSVYLSSVPTSVLPPDAAGVLYDDLVRFIKDALRLLLVAGLIIAAGAFFSGSSAAAVSTRRAFSSALAGVRSGGERAGLRTGPVGQWVYTYRRALRVAAVAIAALVFVFWSQPTWQIALIIAIVLLVVLGLIELIARSPAEPQAAGHDGG